MKTKFTIILIVLVSFFSSVAYAQEITVSGTVTSNEDGLPMPGVSVVVVGTTNGTASDFDGNYSITAQPGQKLMFSFMGFEEKEVTISGSRLDVVLKVSSNVLDEVVVAGVASGTSKKKLSVSVAKVNEKAIKDVPAVNAASALQGKVAGVTVTQSNGTPGGGATILLRGATNITGSQNPMILIDGVIMEGSLSDINVDDIESMEVVKGASASSLYGSRAGNGVIVITTKRGSRLSENKTNVTVRNEFGFQSIARKIDVAEHHAFILASDYMNVDTYTKYAGVTYPADYVTGQDSRIQGDRTMQATQYMDQPYRFTTDQQDNMFTNGLFFYKFCKCRTQS